MCVSGTAQLLRQTHFIPTRISPVTPTISFLFLLISFTLLFSCCYFSLSANWQTSLSLWLSHTLSVAHKIAQFCSSVDVAVSCCYPASPRETELQVCVECNHPLHISLSPCVSLSLCPRLFSCSEYPLLCLEGNQAARANYAALAPLPFFSFNPSFFLLLQSAFFKVSSIFAASSSLIKAV